MNPIDRMYKKISWWEWVRWDAVCVAVGMACVIAIAACAVYSHFRVAVPLGRALDGCVEIRIDQGGGAK